MNSSAVNVVVSACRAGLLKCNIITCCRLLGLDKRVTLSELNVSMKGAASMFGVNTALTFVIQGLTFSRWYVLDCCDTVCFCQSLIFLIILHATRCELDGPEIRFQPIPLTERSKARVCGRLRPGVVSSNPAGGMDACVV